MTDRPDLDKLEALAKAATGSANGATWVQYRAGTPPEVTLSLVAEARRLRRLESALEFLDRSRADIVAGNTCVPATSQNAIALAAKFGWKEDT